MEDVKALVKAGIVQIDHMRRSVNGHRPSYLSGVRVFGATYAADRPYDLQKQGVWEDDHLIELVNRAIGQMSHHQRLQIEAALRGE